MRATDVVDCIAGHVANQPDRDAVRDSESSLTYRQLWDEAGMVAGGLVAEGVQPGDRVALLLPNSVSFVVAALACLKVDAMFVPLAVTDPLARLQGIVADCAPALVVTTGPEAGGEGLTGARHHSLADLRTPEPFEVTPPGPDDRPAYAIYTSGTTGQPKGVVIGRAAFARAVATTADQLGLGPETRTLCVSPFHFDGSFATLFPTLARGGTVVIRAREALLFPRTFIRAVTEERITYTGFSPSYLTLLLASPRIGELADTPLDIIALGGEATAPRSIAEWNRAVPKCRVFNRYGPTETTIAVTHIEITPAILATGVIPIGPPHPHVEFHLLDPDGNLIDQDGIVGELWIGGEQLMNGYWNAPELTAEMLRGDVVAGRTLYRTGDLVYRQADGNYVYVDRADRVVKRRGVRISLLELTEAIRQMPAVLDATCATFDDDDGLGIAAFVVMDGADDEGELRRLLRDALPDTMLPDRMISVPGLPMTSSSKVDERALLADAGLDPHGAEGAA
jgi:amino acid adenylation domain-containing protein